MSADWADEVAGKLMAPRGADSTYNGMYSRFALAGALRSAHRAGMVQGMRENAAFIEAALMHGAAGDNEELAETLAAQIDIFRARADELEKQP